MNSYGDAIRAQPNNAFLYYKRAAVLEEKDEILLALNDYRQATILQPANTDGIRKIGLYHFKVRNIFCRYKYFSCPFTYN